MSYRWLNYRVRLLRRLADQQGLLRYFWRFLGLFERRGPALPVRDIRSGRATAVDQFWNRHTVAAWAFECRLQSRLFLAWRRACYPLFADLMQLDAPRVGQTVLDYGCGPGNDLIEMHYHARARKLVGMDVSRKALEYAAARLAMHRVPGDHVDLWLLGDDQARLPLPDASVDSVLCGGVLMHASNPFEILAEFARVVKPGGEVRLMIYNRDSIWFHLYVPYMQKIVLGKFAGLSDDDAFQRSTDGPDCPLARAFVRDDFERQVRCLGFDTQYLGGYVSLTELNAIAEYGSTARNDPRLDASHREFLQAVVFDRRGFPVHNEKYAGIGGVYLLQKAGTAFPAANRSGRSANSPSDGRF